MVTMEINPQIIEGRKTNGKYQNLEYLGNYRGSGGSHREF